MLTKTFNQSKEVSLLTYDKPILKDLKYYEFVSMFKKFHKKSEVQIIKVILKWKDYIARIEDKPTDLISISYGIGFSSCDVTEDYVQKMIEKSKYLEKYSEQILADVKAKLAKK